MNPKRTPITRRGFLRQFPALALGAPVLFSPAAHASEAGAPVQATVTVAGAYLRSAPALSAGVTQPVFAGNPMTAVGRSADNLWVKLKSDSAGPGWLLAQYVALKGTDSPPLAEDGAFPPPKPGAVPASRFVTAIGPKTKALYAAKAPGKDPRYMSVIGDCNSVPEAYLGRLATGLFDPGAYPNLAATIERFSPSIARLSQAAFRGFNSNSMFSGEWANPNYCQPGEGPLACELRRSRASVIVVALGTGDQFDWKNFEAHYRAILTYIVGKRVLPVVMTKADDLESQQGGAPAGYINDLIRKLGPEYGAPVIDFWAATRALPQYGMRNEGNENFHLSAAGSDTRILLTLQLLDALWRK